MISSEATVPTYPANLSVNQSLNAGFMYAAGSITDFIVSSSVFAFNRAGLLGGVVAAAGSLEHVALMLGSEMHDNRVSGLGGLGGALQAGAIVDVAVSGGSGMWANAATENGGAIHSASSIRCVGWAGEGAVHVVGHTV